MTNVKTGRVNVTVKKFFAYWLKLTYMFHKLSDQKQQVLSLFLYYHYLYKQQITNDKILWKMLFDYDTKQKIQDELDISSQVMANNLRAFKKKGIIQNGKIVPTYIPELTSDAKLFSVIFQFKILHETG